MADKVVREPGLSLYPGRGFQITLENKYTVSVMFGVINYCDNQNVDTMSSPPAYERTKQDVIMCANAEVAVIDPDGELMDMSWFDPHNDDQVVGYVSADRVAQLIAEARLLPYIQKMME